MFWFSARFCTIPLTKDLYSRMSAKDWSEWRWGFSFSGVENRLLLHMMCGTKRLNPFFRLHEASEVLNKYVMGVWLARHQDFAAREAKNHKVGPHFLQYWMYAANGVQHEMGAGHHWPPIVDDPGVWSDSPLSFSLVSLWIFFAPDSAVAAQIWPQNAYRGPEWWFLKNISTKRHIPRPNDLHNKIYPKVLFFHFTFF